MEYLDGKHTVYEGSVLHRFYESFQPASVAGIFGFGKPVHRDLERLPAHALVFPWDRGNMARRLKFRKDFALKENRNRGLFTEQQSLQVFDTVFDGMEPAA